MRMILIESSVLEAYYRRYADSSYRRQQALDDFIRAQNESDRLRSLVRFWSYTAVTLAAIAFVIALGVWS